MGALHFAKQSEASGFINQEKMERHCSIETVSNRIKAIHLRFHRNCDYWLAKKDWKREFLEMEWQVSVGLDRPVKEDHLWRWTTLTERIPCISRLKLPKILALWKAPFKSKGTYAYFPS